MDFKVESFGLLRKFLSIDGLVFLCVAAKVNWGREKMRGGTEVGAL